MGKTITVKVDEFDHVSWGRRDSVNRRSLPRRISAALRCPGEYIVEVVKSGGLPLSLQAEPPGKFFPVVRTPRQPSWFCADFARFVGFTVEGRSGRWNVSPSKLTVLLKITRVEA